MMMMAIHNQQIMKIYYMSMTIYNFNKCLSPHSHTHIPRDTYDKW